MVRQVEPTKVCAVHGERLPWSCFFQTPTGSPRWACKDCERRLARERDRRRRQENPEQVRASARRGYHSRKLDPEWLDTRRAYGREQANRKRRARGIPERPKRGPMVATRAPAAPVLPAGPFIAWLETFGGPGDIERATGLLPRHIRRLREGSVREVELDTVDRAAIHADADIGDIYPLGLAA